MRHLFEAPASASGSETILNGASLQHRVHEAAEAAAGEAEIVDSEGTFPAAAIAAAKRLKLLSLMVPTRLGGQGASAAAAADACFIIARSCASAGMIVAMHHSALACVADHSLNSRWHESLLRRIATEEYLVASSTTEGNQGGNVRVSASPLVHSGSSVSLTRSATVISYGAEADCIVTTARRSPEAPPTDQALAVFTRKDYRLTPIKEWKTLGMRGTRSAGFELYASASEEQVIPVPYKTIHAQTMMPLSHLLWGSVWIGIAAAALSRSQLCTRAAARLADVSLPPGAPLYVKALAKLEGLRARLAVALSDYDRMRVNPASLSAVEKQTHFNLLKVELSEGALDVVAMAMRVCGLAGYREDGEFSVARHYRDVLSAPLMINNERILASSVSSAILSPAPASLGIL